MGFLWYNKLYSSNTSRSVTLWTGFQLFVFRRKEKINREKEDIEKARKSLNKRKPTAASSRNKANYTEDGSFVKPKVISSSSIFVSAVNTFFV